MPSSSCSCRKRERERETDMVDTPTAIQLEAGEAPPAPRGTTTAAAAIHAAQQLCSLAKALLGRRESTVVPYAIAPHVAALIEWLETLDRGNVAVHVQLPPVLTPLREILDQMLRGQAGDAASWARLVAVAEAFEALITRETLTHPSDVLGQSHGGTESPLLCAESLVPEWNQAVETLRGLLQQVPNWPTRVLPTIQQAAATLVRGIAIATPEQHQGGPGEWTPEQWWHAERHHGMGDAARSAAGTDAATSSPRGRARRRPRSPSSDASHRRLLAEHAHGHGL